MCTLLPATASARASACGATTTPTTTPRPLLLRPLPRAGAGGLQQRRRGCFSPGAASAAPRSPRLSASASAASASASAASASASAVPVAAAAAAASLRGGSTGALPCAPTPHRQRRKQEQQRQQPQLRTRAASSDFEDDPSPLPPPPPRRPRVRRGVIDPASPLYRAWWAALIAAAAASGFFVPWEIAFGELRGAYQGGVLHSPLAALDAAMSVLFLADVGLTFFVAFEEEEVLVDEPGQIASRYRSQRLVADVVSAVPLDYAVYATLTGLGGMDPLDASGVAAGFKLLHLIRLYRVRWFFRYLEYDLSFSLLWVTLARNMLIVAYLTNALACGFELWARVAHYEPSLLVGINPLLFTSMAPGDQYLYALYWAVTTLAGNEWNDTTTATSAATVAANTARASVFLLSNITLLGYLIGTITLLLTKNDERTGRYRDLSTNLKAYSAANGLPPALRTTMQEHLRLAFAHQDASDEQVLAIYPTVIRRRILRHLYTTTLRSSYLLSGCPRRFLDALLAAGRVELFKQEVEILSAGEPVNELLLLCSGQVEIRSPLDTSVSFDFMEGAAADPPWPPPSPLNPRVGAGRGLGSSKGEASGAPALTSMLGTMDDADDPGGGGAGLGLGGWGRLAAAPERVAGPGEMLGEIAFFTEIPAMETVRSLTTCRILTISRVAYEALERAFPVASRQVMENLRRHSEAAVLDEFPPGLLPDPFKPSTPSSASSSPSSALNPRAGGGRGGGRGGGSSDNGSALAEGLAALLGPSIMYKWASPELVEQLLAKGGALSNSILTPRQELVVANLVRVDAMIAAHVAKSDEDRTTQFLYAASRGDVAKLRAMVQQGFDPDSADYDGRNALMLAAAKGQGEALELLLSAGASPSLRDNFGSTALLEACRQGHDAVISRLVAAGASLRPAAAPPSPAPPPSAARPTSAAAEQLPSHPPHTPQPLQQQWRRQALSGAAPPPPAAVAGGAGWQQQQQQQQQWQQQQQQEEGGLRALEAASLLCNTVYECDAPLLRRLLAAGAPVDAGDYDKRTALHIAAAEGNLVMVRLLVEEGRADVAVQDRWGATPLDEALRVGAAGVVTYLKARHAASSPLPPTAAQPQQRGDGGGGSGGGEAAVAAPAPRRLLPRGHCSMDGGTCDPWDLEEEEAAAVAAAAAAASNGGEAARAAAAEPPSPQAVTVGAAAGGGGFSGRVDGAAPPPPAASQR